jgi:hypothetical protein
VVAYRVLVFVYTLFTSRNYNLKPKKLSWLSNIQKFHTYVMQKIFTLFATPVINPNPHCFIAITKATAYG